MLQIGKEWRIRRFDDRCLAVEHLETVVNRRDKTERLDWVLKGYHGHLRSAVRHVLRDAACDAVGDGERVSLEHLIEKFDEVERNIVEAVTVRVD